ncbi:hypothetical protein [Stenotrophomonas maltophilia]|uniref:hypothetical protein n=1 Tax=Stenotrophomonas maltophilia TaxID=40324 RepID=UPI003876D2E4
MPLFRPAFVFPLVLPLAACAQSETPRNMSPTQTNEQGCTRQRSIGPQDPYANSAPLKQACVGPYLLELPQNYYSTQMGPQHDGSFRLALEYPSLQPFKPGERMNLSADVSVRTVSVSYAYIDRIDVRRALRNLYTPLDYERDDPSASLEGRIKGGIIHGLEPYYVDMGRVRAYYQAKGYRADAPVMKPVPWHADWFVLRDASGAIDQIIKCTPREVAESGVEYRDGKMVKKHVLGFAECTQDFMIEDMSTLVGVRYPREGMQHWKQIAERARTVFVEHVRDTRRAKP